MTEWLPWVQIPLLVVGCFFFAIGTLGLFRLSETRDRLHALTKVDNLGLGLMVVALLPSAPTVGDALKIVLVWLVVLAASATSTHLIARATEHTEREES